MYKGDNPEWSLIIARIEDVIHSQKLEGAAVGQYNHNIITRDLGLAEKSEVSGKMTLEDLLADPGESDESGSS